MEQIKHTKGAPWIYVIWYYFFFVEKAEFLMINEKRCRISRNFGGPQGKLQGLDMSKATRIVAQNPRTKSKWAKMAAAGAKIVWAIDRLWDKDLQYSSSKWLGRIVDGRCFMPVHPVPGVTEWEEITWPGHSIYENNQWVHWYEKE